MEMSQDSKPAAFSRLRGGRWPAFAHALTIFRKNRGAAIGLWLLLSFAVLALTADIIAPYDPYELVTQRVIHGPLWSDSGTFDHLLGTDAIGRDLLSRLLYGARRSLGFGLLATALAACLGTALGLIAGYYGGWNDRLIRLSLDVLLAVPLYVLALVFAAGATGAASSAGILAAVSLIAAVPFARVLRSRCQELMQSSYIRSAQSYGTSPRRLLLGTILPSCIAPLVTLATLTFGFTLVAGAALSFLGGSSGGTALSLGAQLADGRDLMLSHPWLMIAPGLWLSAIIIAVNLVGDGLRDALDDNMRLWP